MRTTSRHHRAGSLACLLLPIIYIAFVSLGLPDSLLGSSWPVMHESLGCPLASQGLVSMLIAGCTIASSLATDRLAHRLGTGRLTAASVALTAVALVGFSCSEDLLQVCLWALPYGLGAGSVDAALNGYVARHYQTSHMNWLHCCWGVGASIGPMVMAACISTTLGWRGGYRTIAVVQGLITLMLVASLPLWQAARAATASDPSGVEDDLERPEAVACPSRRDLLHRPGTWQIMVAFLCYTALESGCGLWGSSFMVQAKGLSVGKAAGIVSLFYVGITLGRLVSGFLALRVGGRTLVRIGQCLALAGVPVMLLGAGQVAMGTGFFVAGMGCAPIYPSLLQQTPLRFGEDASGTMMGLQMACAYVGSTFFPPLLGLVLASGVTMAYPLMLACVTIAITLCVERGDAMIGSPRTERPEG
jgi:fucose permease